MSALGSRSKPAKPSGSSSSLNSSEDVDDVVDDGRRLLTLWKRTPSSRGAVEVEDEVLEAPRRSHKGLVAAVSQLIPKGPRALGGRCLFVYTRSQL